MTKLSDRLSLEVAELPLCPMEALVMGRWSMGTWNPHVWDTLVRQMQGLLAFLCHVWPELGRRRLAMEPTGMTQLMKVEVLPAATLRAMKILARSARGAVLLPKEWLW